MPRILIKPGQLITLYFNPEGDPQFLANDIGDHLVFVFLNKRTRRLVVASCPPGMHDNVIYFLLYTGVLEKMEPADAVVWLIGGTKTSEDMIATYVDLLDQEHVQHTVVRNFHNLFVTADAAGALMHQDASPAVDFKDFATSKDVREGLLTYAVLTDGDNMKEASRQSLMETMAPAQDAVEVPVDLDVAEIEETMKMYDAMFETFDPHDKRGTVAERKEGRAATEKLISAISQKVTYPEIYGVKAWQTAVVFLGNGRKVRGQLLEGQSAFVVCDQATQLVAICIVGQEAEAAVVDGFMTRCWSSILAGAQQALEKNKGVQKPGSIVYQVIAPSSRPSATFLKKAVAGQLEQHKAPLKGRVVEEAKFGVSPMSPQSCAYADFIVEIEHDKFAIVDANHVATLPDAYRVPVCVLTKKQSVEVKALDDQDPRKLKLRDVRSIAEAELLVDVASNVMLEFDLSRMQCAVELREKTILMGSYCDHTQKLALLQIDTDDLGRFFVADQLTRGHFMALNFFANSPEKIGAPPVKYFLYCRKPTLGHKKDSDACDAYIKIFDASNAVFYANAKSMYTKREGTKFNLHPLGKPAKFNYNEPAGYQCFSLKEGKCFIEFKTSKQLDAVKGLPRIRQPQGAQNKAFYVSLGVKAMDNYKMSEAWVATVPSGTKPVAIQKPASVPRP